MSLTTGRRTLLQPLLSTSHKTLNWKVKGRPENDALVEGKSRAQTTHLSSSCVQKLLWYRLLHARGASAFLSSVAKASYVVIPTFPTHIMHFITVLSHCCTRCWEKCEKDARLKTISYLPNAHMKLKWVTTRPTKKGTWQIGNLCGESCNSMLRKRSQKKNLPFNCDENRGVK